MNGFIGHIIDRHLSSDTSVAPRLPGRFEPPAVTSNHPRNENLAFSEPIQPNAVHTEVGERANRFNWQNQTERTGEPPIVPDAIRVERKESINNEENPIEHRVTRPSDTSVDRPTNKTEFIPLKQSPGQSNPETVALNPVQAVNTLVIYEPTPSTGHVPNETQKKQSNVKPNVVKPNTENGEERPVHPAAVAPSFVIPAFRRSADLRFRASGLQDQPQPPPVINVSIGRIEVKAVQAQQPVKTARTESPSPKMSLDEYLNKRNSTY